MIYERKRNVIDAEMYDGTEVSANRIIEWTKDIQTNCLWHRGLCYNSNGKMCGFYLCDCLICFPIYIIKYADRIEVIPIHEFENEYEIIKYS